jgi:hypothetical protein
MIEPVFARVIRHSRAVGATVLLTAVLAAVLAACGASTAPATGVGSSAPSAAGSIELPADFPLGSWTSTITEADLEAAGISDPNLLRENVGTFTTTFSPDGTWTTAQDTSEPVKWPVFRGTFRATGDGEMEQVTTFPPDYAGDVVCFTWRLEDGALILNLPEPPDPILPIVVESHPWERAT